MPIHGYPGNVITANPTAPTVSSASGVWTTEQQLLAVNQGNWPGYEYPLSNSLRFNSADSASLTRTFGTPTSRTTWTMNLWFKRSTLGTTQYIFHSRDAGNTVSFECLLNTTDNLIVRDYSGSAYNSNYVTTQVFRDPSAWYVLTVKWDTTNATAANRCMIFINGIQITAFSTSSAPSQNLQSQWNVSGYLHSIGSFYNVASYYNGYLTEINFIDGQALDPSSFGLNDPETGVWSPKRYTGTYGTNGFYLPFNFDVTNFSADYLVVAGGGGGGGYYVGAGGGAGGYREFTSQSLALGTAYTVTVGAGGNGAANSNSSSGRGSDGSNSVLSTITSTGGGGGGLGGTFSGSGTATYQTGNNGGSGGGGGGRSGGNTPGTPVSGGSGNTPSTSPSQGNNGGTGVDQYYYSGGGGGGASAVGGNGQGSASGSTAGSIGGNGGAGTASSITGSSVTRAGGGGGGAWGTAGTGGSGGGGNGTTGSNGSNGTANTGGGGGGSGASSGTGGNGGSGVVIIKIPSYLTATFSGGVTSSLSTAVSGFKIYTVTATSTTSETVTFS